MRWKAIVGGTIVIVLAACGGLGWGDGVVSCILAVLIVGFVWYLAATRVDVDRSHVNA